MKWISVEDRLPDEGQRVLIWFEHTGYDICLYSRVSTDMVGENFNVDCFSSAKGWLGDEDVYWMPLPEPPELLEDTSE